MNREAPVAWIVVFCQAVTEAFEKEVILKISFKYFESLSHETECVAACLHGLRASGGDFCLSSNLVLRNVEKFTAADVDPTVYLTRFARR